jgi:hypothetical protein
MSPDAVIAAQMQALQRPDWPEAEAGLRAVHAFAMPSDTLAPFTGAVRSWHAAEQWLSRADFAAMLQQPPYRPMLGCDSWRPISRVHFPRSRVSSLALQAVEVTAPHPARGPGSATEAARQQLAQQWSAAAGGAVAAAGGSPGAGDGGAAAPQPAAGSAAPAQQLRTYKFTFLLERVDSGPLAGCYVTIGVRQGDYSC